MVEAITGDPSVHNIPRPRAPYVPRVRVPWEPELKVIEGVKPHAQKFIPYVLKLLKALIPRILASTLTTSSAASRENIQAIERAFLLKLLDAELHGRFFKILLWIEEFKMECASNLFFEFFEFFSCCLRQDLERYDMVDSTLARNIPFYQ